MVGETNIDQDIRNFILSAVDKNWKENEKVLLLNKLGYSLKKSIPESGQFITQGIKKYLQQNPIVQTIVYPGIDEKIGLIPLGVSVPKDAKELFDHATKLKAVTETVVYDQLFWNAFIDKIVDRRFICLDNNGRVVISNVNPIESAILSREVLPSDISTDSAAEIVEKVKGTHDKIDAWLIRNDLQRSLFLKHRSTGVDNSVNKFELFQKLFGGLSLDEQARVLIPADIILKLMGRR